MHLSVVSSLDSQCRDVASARLASTHAKSVVVHHDLLDGSVVLRRVWQEGVLTERAETVLEHGCLSCTVRLDLVPTVDRLLRLGHEHAVLGLPPGVSVDSALAELGRALGDAISVDNAAVAVDPADLEDHIWDRHTLYESGFTAMPEDDRTSGEFLIGELSHVDTVLIHPGLGSELGSALGGGPREASDSWRHGVELIGQLAPHSTVAGAGDPFTPACYDPREAAARTRRGSVRVPVKADTGSFRTVLHAVERPLHPARFQEALPQLAAGSHWLRGRLWIASAACKRIAVQGIGPRVWLENAGEWLADRGVDPAGRTASRLSDVDALLDWHPLFGDRGTVIAVTGRCDDVDAGQIRQLLDGCQLSEVEMEQEFGTLEDPLSLESSL